MNTEGKTEINNLIDRIRSNMKKCNVGDIYGPLYEAGYRQGVADVVKMMMDLTIK